LNTEHKATAEEESHSIAFEFNLEGNKPIELISAKANYYSQEFSKTKAVFIKTDGLIVGSEEKTAEHTVLSAANGVLQIKSSAEFAPSVFSITYKGHEWLDSDFPNKPCKSWWNQWFGGISSYPTNLKEHHRLAEKTETAFVKRTDSQGNIWEGIAITTKMEKFDAYKGATIKQYYLMLPNLPVIAIYSEVEQNCGFYKEYTNIAGDMFVKPDSDLTNIETKVVQNGKENIVKCGHEGVETYFKANLYLIKAKTRAEKMHYYNADPQSEGECYSDTSTISTCFEETRKIKNGETKVFPPKFIIFCENELTEANLVDLQNIRFE